MVEYLDLYTYLVSSNCIIAQFTNAILIFLICKYSRPEIGGYKYLLITFACFNITYAWLLFFAIPVNFLADQAWMVFTHGPLANTIFSFWGSGLYCTFYEIWICLVLIHFVFRFLAVCKPDWLRIIKETIWAKMVVISMMIGAFLFTIVCGNIFCGQERMRPNMVHILQTQFHIEHPEEMGYILLTTRKHDGSISFLGTASIVNHFILSYIFFSIMIYCGIRTWRTIKSWQNLNTAIKNANVQRQLFIALVVQTLVPFLLCHLPTMVYLSFPFWGTDFNFGPFSIIFAYLTSLNKVIDPCITIICIKEYRRALIKIVKERRIATQIKSTSGNPGKTSMHSSSAAKLEEKTNVEGQTDLA